MSLLDQKRRTYDNRDSQPRFFAGRKPQSYYKYGYDPKYDDYDFDQKYNYRYRRYPRYSGCLNDLLCYE